MTYEPMGSDRDPSAESGQGGPPWKLIGLLVLVAALVVFIVQNGQRADVNFLTFDGSWPVWLVIAVSVVLGMLLDRLGSWVLRRRR